jgi:tetratricopeptide (TPR) repeat protein
VTLAAIFCGAAILIAGRREGKTFMVGSGARAGLLAAILAVGAFSFVGVMGQQALAASKDAERDGQLTRAESEAQSATRWTPWSVEAWERVADVRFAQNDLPGARAALLEAIEKDSADWALWYDLGVASRGREQLRAYREAARLNPLGKNVAVLRTLRVLPPLTKERNR